MPGSQGILVLPALDETNQDQPVLDTRVLSVRNRWKSLSLNNYTLFTFTLLIP